MNEVSENGGEHERKGDERIILSTLQLDWWKLF